MIFQRFLSITFLSQAVFASSLGHLPVELIIKTFDAMGVNSRLSVSNISTHFSSILEGVKPLRKDTAHKLFFAAGVDQLHDVAYGYTGLD